MTTLDYVLGIAEFGLVVASVWWLVMATRRRARLRGPVALCLIAALTIAQPFGVVASPDEAPRRGGAMSLTDVHLIRGPAGLRIPFAVYHREDALGGLAENTTHASLRVRSWFWAPVLTNSTRVADICANDSQIPCWDPDTQGGDHNLVLTRSGGHYWVTLKQDAPLPRIRQTWRLRLGVASPLGFLYWLVVLTLAGVARWRSHRPNPRAAPAASPST